MPSVATRFLPARPHLWLPMRPLVHMVGFVSEMVIPKPFLGTTARLPLVAIAARRLAFLLRAVSQVSEKITK